MSDKLPVDYRDYPTAYVGQPLRAPAEEYGDFPDRAKADAPAGRQDANDALDYQRPSGAATTPELVGQPIVVMPALPAQLPPEMQIKKPKIVWREEHRNDNR